MVFVAASSAFQTPQPPVELTAQEDHKRLMDLLHITELRRGADGRNPQAPNAANYDESKANPYPATPNPLVLKTEDRGRLTLVRAADYSVFGG